MEQQSLFTPQCSLDGLVLIRDSLQADGAFLVPYSLRAALQQGLKVLVVTLENTVGHYQHVLRKMGTNLPACMSDGRISLVEALPDELVSSSDLPEDACEQLLDRVEARVQELAGDGSTGVCLVIDSLTALRCMQGSKRAWRCFVHRCSMMAASAGAVTSLVALLHADVEGDVQWACYLEHAAQVVIEVEALESGQALDITGKLAVVRRAASWAAGQQQAQLHSGEPVRRLLNYKLTDSGVRLTQCHVR